MPETTILILGLGDLGRRIALGLSRSTRVSHIVLASRHASTAGAQARLVGACSAISVRAATVDGLDSEALRVLIEREQPDLVVQCASLMSPWALHERSDGLAGAMRAGGFALQLPAQLPVITALMRAVRASGRLCPVVNCSFPDVTHPILAAQGLAPTIGIGNAGMILGLARAALGLPPQRLRVLAHHAHVAAVACAERARLRAPGPRVFVGEHEMPDPGFLFEGPPIALNRELNALSAAHALAIIDAMLPGGAPLATAAPGPLSLPGGWPIRIDDGHITLDLPQSVDQAECIAFQHTCARADGIEHIASDGTVHFTDQLKECLPAAWRHLALPLEPDAALERHLQFLQALDVRA